MNSPTTSGIADPRYSKRLAIIVPYRDRADHLARFVPHLVAYFERDKLDRQAHKHAGFSAPNVWNDVGRRTNALFAKREPDFEKLIAQDSISTLKFRLVEKKPLAPPGASALPNVFHYIVDLGEPEPGAV